jgi:hypothetical protein
LSQPLQRQEGLHCCDRLRVVVKKGLLCPPFSSLLLLFFLGLSGLIDIAECVGNTTDQLKGDTQALQQVIGGIAEAFSEAVDEGLAPVDVVADALAQNQVKRKGIPVQNWDGYLFSCFANTLNKLITSKHCFSRIVFFTNFHFWNLYIYVKLTYHPPSYPGKFVFTPKRLNTVSNCL